MIKKIEDILKIIFLLLISILVIVIIIQEVEPKKDDNISKYMSWCKDNYSGNGYPRSSWIKECVENYQKVENDLKN